MLYTFGYEGIDQHAFIARLRGIGIDRVVDVREVPQSRKAGYSKTAFGAALHAAGIRYVHIPTLGCPKLVRDQFRRDRNWAAYTKAFIKHLSLHDDVIVQLAVEARRTALCLVCFEADFRSCHRTYVARAASVRGGPAVMHLTLDSMVADCAELAEA